MPFLHLTVLVFAVSNIPGVLTAGRHKHIEYYNGDRNGENNGDRNGENGDVDSCDVHYCYEKRPILP